MDYLSYEKAKYKILMKLVDEYKVELMKIREETLKMPIETENGFNIEREEKLIDIDDKMAILKRHAQDPYFAKLVFEDVDDKVNFQGYIGRISFGDIKNPTDEKIIDWRAPIADLYYNGRIGLSHYTALDTTYNVDLKLKRQIKIKDYSVESIYDFEEQISNDEFLVPFLTQSADNRLKNIVATIQEEQNSIIRLPLSKNCIVQGVAGSGKTTVALHRLSYLIYNYKKQIFPEEILIISPNEIFMSYISAILVDLDADKANSFSLFKIVRDLLEGDFTLLNKQTQANYLIKNKIPVEYLGFKGSKEFVEVLKKFLVDFKRKLFYKPLVVKGIEVLGADDVFKFFENDGEKNYEKLAYDGCKKLSRALSIFGELQAKALKNIEKVDIDIHTKFAIIKLIESGNFGYVKKLFNTKFSIAKIYGSFILDLQKYTKYKQVKILQEYTLKNLRLKKLAYDDLGAVLYIYATIFELPYYEKLKSVFIDEAQDLSVVMYSALRKIFAKANFSIFGDIAQGIYSYQTISNWEDIMDIIGDCELLYLNRSYRTSVEIMQDANIALKKLGFVPANNVVRHGAPVEYVKNNNLETIRNQIIGLNKEFAHTAIICKDNIELLEASEKLKSLNLAVLDENNLSYGDIQNTLMSVQTAKGLEFDSIIIYSEKSYSEKPNDLKLLYVAKTRALHKLIIDNAK